MPIESRTAADASNARSARRFLFPKAARILKQDDFERVFAQNHEIAGKYLVARAGFGDGTARRLGLKVTKKTFHLSVERNRAKRLLRESFRLVRPSLSGEDWDLVVIARRRILGVKQQAVQSELEWACRKLGILRRSRVGASEGGSSVSAASEDGSSEGGDSQS
jgi:ribonuclease P protein component, eubacterial